MRIEYAVVGHHSRRESATKLARSLNAALAMDEGGTGSLRNHDLAWKMAYSPDADWIVVLEDDAILLDGFENHVQEALQHVPRDGAVSFYTGTGQPFRYPVSAAVKKALRRGASWLRANSLYWGPAVALPVHHVQPMLRFVKDIDRPYDQRLGLYLLANRYPCFYTMPSLVDHQDGESLIQASDRVRRAHVFKQPSGWNKKVVRII